MLRYWWRLLRRSRDVDSLAGRSRRSGSVKSAGSNRSGSADSVCSTKSDASRTSRTSQRAKIAGLKAEIDVLRTEGPKEIADRAKEMKDAIAKFEEEEKIALSAEIAEKERLIKGEEELCEDTGTYKLDLNEIRHTGEVLSKEGNVKVALETKLKHKSKTEPPTQIQQKQPQTQNEQYANVNQSLIQMMKAQAAPKVEIDEFGGDILDYTYIISNFETWRKAL